MPAGRILLPRGPGGRAREGRAGCAAAVALGARAPAPGQRPRPASPGERAGAQHEPSLSARGPGQRGVADLPERGAGGGQCQRPGPPSIGLSAAGDALAHRAGFRSACFGRCIFPWRSHRRYRPGTHDLGPCCGSQPGAGRGPRRVRIVPGRRRSAAATAPGTPGGCLAGATAGGRRLCRGARGDPRRRSPAGL